MPHTKADVIKAENDFLNISNHLISIYTGKIQALRNGMNAVSFGRQDVEEPLELANVAAGRQTIKDLADKISGNGV